MKIVAIDVDGTIADLAEIWLARYNKDWNDNLKKKAWIEWGVDKFVKPECGIKIFDYLEDPTIYDDVLPIEGAKEGVDWLRQYHRVIL